VSVAKFPDGKDPGDLAISDPAALAAAIDEAVPFLGFRVNRVVSGKPLRSPEDRARLAAQAMEVINEHPDVNVRKLYAGEIAARVGLPVADLSRLAERRSAQPVVAAPVARGVGVSENAEFIAISLLLQSWDDIAPWLIEALFVSEIPRRAFLTLATASEIETGSLLNNALGIADPEVREMLERAAVADIEVEPSSVALNLIGVTVRRILSQRTRIAIPEEIREDRDARVQLENLDNERTALAAAESLLMWLAARTFQPGGRGDNSEE
jgi:DNA primase